ncbi:unnamed protein product [Periconia digitata]|uniref:Uncharacterized protein n=1 Tax=Periconia digitata TaxID=1303443 RepID=A0A9W4UNT6_9PLEO|nr:unnamed protein product [Periconia digitata]
MQPYAGYATIILHRDLTTLESLTLDLEWFSFQGWFGIGIEGRWLRKVSLFHTCVARFLFVSCFSRLSLSLLRLGNREEAMFDIRIRSVYEQNSSSYSSPPLYYYCKGTMDKPTRTHTDIKPPQFLLFYMTHARLPLPSHQSTKTAM